MKELTMEALREILDIVQSSKEFVIEQAPGYAQELVRYTMWHSGIGIILSLALLCLVWEIVFKVRQSTKDSESKVSALIVGGFASLVVLIPAICEWPVLLKAVVAPKVLIVEHIMSVFK